MSHLRVRLLFTALLLALLIIPGFLIGCGSSDPDPIDGEDIDIIDVDIPDTPVPDAGLDADADVDGDADGDTGPTDPGPETIECDNPIPEPPSGERCTVTPGSSDNILLRGTILVGDDIYVEGSILLDDDSPNRAIICSGCDCADEAQALDATEVACPDGVISPGLINPHDHLTFAEGRPQLHGEERFDHRHDWRRGERGHTQLSTNPRSGPHREVVLLGELRMLFGGSTSIAGSVGSTDASGFLRNLDNRNHTEGLETIDVNYSTFPLGDSTPVYLSDGCGYPGIQSESNVENSNIYLPHIGEGVDREAQNELHCLAGASGRNLIRSNTSIIHGIAVDARDVAMIADRGANLVWSARTNIDLYGNTAPVTLYHRFGVPISLGTDWSTSGSMNMLRELQCADYLNRMHYNETFTDQDLWKMATYNGAISMGAEHKLGALHPGYIADITIFDGRDRSPYRAVIDAEIDDITLVMRGGEPLYGDAELIEDMVAADDIDKCEVVDVCSRNRRLCSELDAGMTLSQIQSGVHQNSYPIFFCEEPEDEPSCVPFRPSEYDGISTSQDRSGDGIPDVMDNCPDYFNPIRPMDGGLQSNVNGNSLGDVCDPCPLSEDPNCTEVDPGDWSGDGIPNEEDNCPFHYNPDQEDSSEDGIGDACHPCPEHALSDGGACPGSIYDIKTQELGPGARVALNDVLVTGVLPGEGLFVQVHPDDDEFNGVDYSGLYVFLRNAFEESEFPVQGDRISLSGSISHFFGQIQLATVTNLEIHSSANPLPAPVVVDPDDIATGGQLQEALEATVVSVEQVEVTNVDVAPGPGDSSPSNEFIVNGSLNINNFFHLIEPFPAAGDTFESITGVLQWANSRSKLNPRSENDVISGPPVLDRFDPEFAYLEVSGVAEPTLTVYLNRATDEDLTIDLIYGSGAIEGPTTVVVQEGENSATVELEALSTEDDPIEVRASLDGDGDDIFAHVQTFDSDTPRFLESLTGEETQFLAGSTLTLEASLNVPADAPLDLNFVIEPPLDALYTTEFQFDTGEQVVEIVIQLGTDIGSFEAQATVGATTLTYEFDVNLAAFVETFDNLSLSGSSYVAGTFVGDAGFEWEYSGARTNNTEEGGNGDSAVIDGTTLTFGTSSHDPRFIRAENIAGGISAFSLDMKQSFTGSGPRQVELFINGESRGTSEPFGSSADDAGQVFEFIVEDLDIAGEFDLEVRSIAGRQIAIDNLSWTAKPTGVLANFSPESLELEVSETGMMSVELFDLAEQSMTIELSYSDSDAVDGPGEVIIAAGESSAEISLTALEARAEPIVIEASLGNEVVTGLVRTFDDNTPRQVNAVDGCHGGIVGQTLTFSVQLDLPAPSGGLVLSTTADPTNSLSAAVPDVNLAAGETSADVAITFDGEPALVQLSFATPGHSKTIEVPIVDETSFGEDLEAFPSTNGYDFGTYVGNHGFQWEYSGAQRTESDAIDGVSAIFGGNNPSFVRTENIPGGISSFSMEMRRAFTNERDRQLELFINDESVATSVVFGTDDQLHTFEVDDLAISCVESLEVRSVFTSNQITIDNITWAPVDP